MARTKEEAASVPADLPPRRTSRVSTDGVQKPASSGRSRGRPRLNKPPKEPSGRPRGRPRLDKPPKEPSGRPRGRPKGSGKKSVGKETPTKTTATAPGRRGRPRKLLGGEVAAMVQASGAASGEKKTRGRPKKAINATRVAEAETVEEAKDATEEVEDAEEMDVDEGAPIAEIEGDVEVAEDCEDDDGDDEAPESPTGMVSWPEEETGQQWLSKIKGYFG
ncbi:AT hook-like protein [Metarhizium rileyi]|uniref:AT hook-like protein n=1 Tax=Metarhizium rileyi (strain RCEF 4871) TaxID=1649241 RepID=A0A167FM47_METRR|nr:AT hook-like protein [Metarhizium rileyi RCEF 4871]TWU78341.1 hypothetical protein ED733_008556 [Metarhizium rileyi]